MATRTLTFRTTTVLQLHSIPVTSVYWWPHLRWMAALISVTFADDSLISKYIWHIWLKTRLDRDFPACHPEANSALVTLKEYELSFRWLLTPVRLSAAELLAAWSPIGLIGGKLICPWPEVCAGVDVADALLLPTDWTQGGPMTSSSWKNWTPTLCKLKFPSLSGKKADPSSTSLSHTCSGSTCERYARMTSTLNMQKLGYLLERCVWCYWLWSARTSFRDLYHLSGEKSSQIRGSWPTTISHKRTVVILIQQHHNIHKPCSWIITAAKSKAFASFIGRLEVTHRMRGVLPNILVWARHNVAHVQWIANDVREVNSKNNTAVTVSAHQCCWELLPRHSCKKPFSSILWYVTWLESISVSLIYVWISCNIRTNSPGIIDYLI